MSAKVLIERLAAHYQVSHQHTALDQYCEKITQLSGDNIVYDDTEYLVIALRRARILDGVFLTILLSQYYSER